MAKTTHKKTTIPKKTIQCRRNRKQGGTATVLHRPRHPHWLDQYQYEVLPYTARRTQGDLRLPLVRSSTTQDRLEKRLDRPHTTAHCVQNRRRSKSTIPTTH